VFETLLVVEGRPIELDAHLERLEASTRFLYGAPCPPTARALLLDHARGARLARMRLTVVPGGDDELAVEVAVAAVDACVVLAGRDRAVDLAPLVVGGGIGAHKWADRRLLASAEAALAPCVPLLVDRDGSVLEASRGNVFAVRDGVLITPPADERILPGVTRRVVMGISEAVGIPVREQAVSTTVLIEADEVFLTGSVRGIEPVRSCGAVVVGSAHAVTSALSQELRRRWTLVQGGKSGVPRD